MASRTKDTKNLRQRDGDTWHFRKEIDGEEITFPLDTKDLREAQERRDDIIRDLKSGKWNKESFVRTFSDLVSIFREDAYHALKPKTRAKYDTNIKALSVDFATTPLASITPAKLRRFETRRRADGLSGLTIESDLRCLSSMFRTARIAGWGRLNPVADYMEDRGHRGESKRRARTRYLTHDEEAQILDQAGPKPAQAMMFAIDTGLRKEEQFSLMWSDVFLSDGVVRVKSEVAKSGLERFVPLLPRSEALLRRMEKERDGLYVFTTKSGQRYSSESPTMYEALQVACRKANIKNHVQWHDLRRTCGCRLLQDLKYRMIDVSVWLGHASVKMTAERYAFLRSFDLRDDLKSKSAQVVALTERQKSGPNRTETGRKPDVLSLNPVFIGLDQET